MKIEVVCDLCGKKFLKEKKSVNLSIKRKHKQYCSKECRLKSKIKKIESKCSYCGKLILITKKQINRSKSNLFFCSRSCSSSFNKNNKKLSDETKNKISNSLKEFNKNNKYCKKTTISNKIKKICPMCNNEFFVYRCNKNKIYCSRDCFYNDHELKFRKKSSGGKRTGSGIGKHGWYKNYYCDSSWELAFVIYNLEHNIKFSRNKVGFEYEYENKIHKFYPDFIMEDGTYIEIKGYFDKKNIIKISSFNGSLKILNKIEIAPYLKYVINKYGKDFIKLYENNRYFNECIICGKPAKNICCSRRCSGKLVNKVKYAGRDGDG